jgi:hypothetical protein
MFNLATNNTNSVVIETAVILAKSQDKREMETKYTNNDRGNA